MPGICQTTTLAIVLLILCGGFGTLQFARQTTYSVTDTVLHPPSPESDFPAPAVEPEGTTSTLDVSTPIQIAAAENTSTSQSIIISKSLRPLITYVYAESVNARQNLKFFLKKGLHGAADFIFIINGITDAAQLIPNKTNIRIVERPNECFDLGAHGEVLRKDNLWKKYRRFIALNASIRGPFIPYWASSCWSDAFLNRVTDEVKLVGMTANCIPKFHIQSMIWATDSIGMGLLLFPPPDSSEDDLYGTSSDMVAFEGCYKDMQKAVHGEIGATAVFKNANYKVDAIMSAFHKSMDYEDDCAKNPIGDILWDKQYYGSNLHPYDSIFIKANRDIDPVQIEHLTEWHLHNSDGGSWDACK